MSEENIEIMRRGFEYFQEMYSDPAEALAAAGLPA
jgi:hypothetical protein